MLSVVIAARHELLHYLGFDCDLVAREGRALALSKQSIQYLKPLRSRDSIKSVIQLKKIGMARVVMKQDVFKIKTEEDEVRQVGGQCQGLTRNLNAPISLLHCGQCHCLAYEAELQS